MPIKRYPIFMVQEQHGDGCIRGEICTMLTWVLKYSNLTNEISSLLPHMLPQFHR